MDAGNSVSTFSPMLFFILDSHHQHSQPQTPNFKKLQYRYKNLKLHTLQSPNLQTLETPEKDTSLSTSEDSKILVSKSLKNTTLKKWSGDHYIFTDPNGSLRISYAWLSCQSCIPSTSQLLRREQGRGQGRRGGAAV